MIQIDRGPEPTKSPNLPAIRSRHLAAARLAYAAAPASPAFDFGGYTAARAPLYAAQHKKCAYCERPQGLEEQPVEHFRAKDGAQRDPDDPKSMDGERYWWLAWSWENMLFACKTCNGKSHKANHFPIVGAPLPVLSFDLGAESPQLVDPSREDPLLHIKWNPVDPTVVRDQLRWFPTHRSDRGKMTIRIFKLRGLEDHASGWVKDQILEDLGHIEELLARARQEAAAGHVAVATVCDAGATAAWGRLIRRLFAKSVGWHALSWCALNYLFPEASRPPGWVLPRPGRVGTVTQPTGLPPTPADKTDLQWWQALAEGTAP